LHGALADTEDPCQLSDAFSVPPALPEEFSVPQSGCSAPARRQFVVAAAGKGALKAGWKEVAALIFIVEIVG